MTAYNISILLPPIFTAMFNIHHKYIVAAKISQYLKA